MSGRCAGGYQFSHRAWLGAGGSVSATLRRPGSRFSIGASVQMLSVHQRMLSGKCVNDAVHDIVAVDTGSSGEVKLASERIGLLWIKAVAARASFQLVVITGANTSIPGLKIPIA